MRYVASLRFTHFSLSGIIHLSVSYAQDMSCDIYRSQKLDIPFEFRFGLTVRSMQIYPFAQQPGFVSGNSSRGVYVTATLKLRLALKGLRQI